MKQSYITIIADRVKVVVLGLVWLFSVTAVSAQNQQQMVRFPSAQPSVLEVIESIQRQSDFVFAINLSSFDIQQRVSLSETRLSVAKALSETFDNNGRRYVVNGRQIVVINTDNRTPARRAPEKPAETNITSTPLPANFEKAVSDYTAHNSDTWAPMPAKPSVSYDTIRHLIPHDGFYAYDDLKIKISDLDVVARTAVPASEMPLLKVKTNLLYGGATLTPNLSAEIGLGRRTSLELMGSWNPWRREGTMNSNKKLAHIVIKPEFRYWLCERFNGHYFGAHAFFWRYNIGSHDIPLLPFQKEYRYDGRAAGIGLSYGYYWPWSESWGMEFNVGLGVAFINGREMPFELSLVDTEVWAPGKKVTYLLTVSDDAVAMDYLVEDWTDVDDQRACQSEDMVQNQPAESRCRNGSHQRHNSDY